MKIEVLTHSPLGLPITAYRFKSEKNSAKSVLILGGVHGDEIEGVWAAQYLLSQWIQKFDLNLKLTLIPIFNPDGVFLKTRTNSNGVDLNRNLPTQDWSPEIKTERYHPGPSACSEPENKALSDLINNESPQLIISLHSWKPMLNINGNCKRVAEDIQKLTGYIIDEDIGYPTPGCLGSYAGLERNSPTITYEIERGLDAKNILKTHVPAILQALKNHQATD